MNTNKTNDVSVKDSTGHIADNNSAINYYDLMYRKIFEISGSSNKIAEADIEYFKENIKFKMKDIETLYLCSVDSSNDVITNYIIDNNLYNPNMMSLEFVIDTIKRGYEHVINRYLKDGYCFNKYRMESINSYFSPDLPFDNINLNIKLNDASTLYRYIKLNKIKSKLNSKSSHVISKEEKEIFINYCLSTFKNLDNQVSFFLLNNDCVNVNKPLSIKYAMTCFLDLFLDYNTKMDKLSKDEYHSFFNFIFEFCIHSNDI